MSLLRENRIVIFVIGGIVLLGAIFYFAVGSDENAAKKVVTDFGSKLQQVSLLSAEASSSMASMYGPYVDTALLSAWQKDPRHAPGRLTSSPWPDRIEVVSIAPQGSGFVVQGAVVLMTSEEKEKGGYVGFVPVMIQIVPEDGSWHIVAYQEQATSTRQ